MKPQTLPKISLRKLSHKQLFTLVNRLTNEWDGRESVPPVLKLLIQELTERLNWLEKILKREQSSELTKKINELDELRDKAYKLLARKVRNAQYEFDQPLIDAGARLLPIVEKFNWEITKESFAEQTASTKMALTDFKKEENALHVETLGLTPHIDRVETYNNEFEKVWIQRDKDVDDTENLPLLRDVRLQTERLVRLLLQNSEFFYSMNHNAVDDNLYNTLANELTSLSATIKMRDTLSESSSDA